MSRPKLLVIDDGDRHIELCHALLQDYDYATRCNEIGPCWRCPKRVGCTLTHAHDLREAEEALSRHADIDGVLLDLSFELPDDRLAPSEELDPQRRRALQGLDILRALRRERPSLPVVLMTERAMLDYADAADRLFADEYVTLAGRDAFDAQALALLLERALPSTEDAATGYVWGDSAKMKRLRRDVLALAATSLPLLLLGETGTGKTRLCTDVLHPASGRHGPLVMIDLSALPADLVAGELFGSARGAYSGATDRKGAFEAADGGTLFLDEVGNLPLDAQRVLLVALERGCVTRLGETRTRPTDVKVIAATNVDLAAAVRDGRFRADLYARLNPSVRIELVPLRDRPSDLPALIEHFVAHAFDRPSDRALLDRYAARAVPGVELGERVTRGATLRFALDRLTTTELKKHAWPGNLRQLRGVVTTAVLLTLAGASRLGATRKKTHTLPVSRKLVRELLGAHVAATQALDVALPPQKRLHDVARLLERRLYEQLFRETQGKFDDMAERLLGKRDLASSRRVRLRYNQLGLKARRRDS